MQENKSNLKQQLETLEQWKDDPFLGASECWYFYDWFCKRQSLARKSQQLFSRLKTFLKHVDIDLEKTYVFFKNNCPVPGPLYDDFRICDLETGNVIYTVVPSYNGQSEVWGSANDFKEPLFEGKGMREVCALIDAAKSSLAIGV